MRRVCVATLILFSISAAARAGQVTHTATFKDAGFYSKLAGQDPIAMWNPSPFSAPIPRYNDFARPLLGVTATFVNEISIGDGMFTYRYLGAGLVNSTLHASWSHVTDDLMINEGFQSQNAFSGTIDHSYGENTVALWGSSGQPVWVPGGLPDKKSLTVNLPLSGFVGAGSLRMDVPITTKLEFLDPLYEPLFEFSMHIFRSGSFSITYTFADPPPLPTAPVPEPSTIATLAAGLAIVGLKSLRRLKAC